MTEFKKFILYSISFYILYTIALYFLGFFSIGLLSDDYLNFYDALHSTFFQKITGSLPFTNAFHIRPIYYLSLEKSVNIHDWFGFAADDFIWYRAQNLVLLLFIAFAAGCTVFYRTKKVSVSLVTSAAILLFPNNINNICWTAARVDLLCCLFYLITILLFIIYLDRNKPVYMVIALVTFLLALLTKELAITLPFTAMLIGYYKFGKEGLKKASVMLVLLLVLLISYFVFRILILGNNITEIATLYQANPLGNAPGVLARAFISLTIPMDYLSLNYQLRNDSKPILLYLLVLYGAGFYLIWSAVRTDIYRLIGQAALLFFVLIAPYTIVGYIRPQMILLPFVIMTIHIMYTYSSQSKLSIRLNKNILRACFAVALLFWGYWTGTAVTDWSTSYRLAKVNVENLIRLEKPKDKKMILIGNPGRYKQTFMFDKMTGAYNFWKTRNFEINDTINDIIQTAAIEEGSIGAKPEVKSLGQNVFEIRTKAPKHFFYIEGYDNERIRSGFKNEQISVEFTEYNNIDKPVRMILKILSPDVACYLAGNLDFERIY